MAVNGSAVRDPDAKAGFGGDGSRESRLTPDWVLLFLACCFTAALIQSGRGDRPYEATATWRGRQGANSCPMGRDKILDRPGSRSLKIQLPT
jgi:hypothetical protein